MTAQWNQMDRRIPNRSNGGVIELDSHALAKELDGEDQQPTRRLAAHEDPLEPGQRAVLNAHPLAFAEVWMRNDRGVAAQEPLQPLDLEIGNRRQPVPPLPKDADKTACLEHA